MDISDKVKFSQICSMLEKIYQADSVTKKEKHLKRCIESFKNFSQENLNNSGSNSQKASFYPVLRILIPNVDNARNQYGIQTTTLGKIYVKILGLPESGDDAQKLYGKIRTEGEYSDVVYQVMKARAKAEPSQMTLADVHRILDVIASEDRRATERELTKFIEQTSAFEQKWFIRILLKRLNLRIGEQKIFAIYHPQAKDFYTRYTDLQKVCESVERGDTIDMSDVIRPFQHVRAMLCEPAKIPKLEEMFKSSTCYVETKMDGERFQLHLSNETFKYISRNGVDYTRNFGRNVTEGNLTPLVASLLDISVKSVILDGEMMVWDKSTGSYRVKGENIDVKHLPVGGNLRPCYVVYDLLYLNGSSCIDLVYVERRAKLQKIFKERIGILALNGSLKLSGVEHFKDVFNDAMKRNEEGVVIKKQMSVYKPGSRTAGWFKVKPDYIRGITSDFDLIILGGVYNKSKTSVETFMVGVIKANSENETNPMFYCVGKVAQGLSDAQRAQLNQNLSAFWIKTGRPDNVEFGAANPSVSIEPRNSVILQLRASELSPSDSFYTPYTLRFPRIECIRNDKVWNECMTLEEYEGFYKGDNGVKKVTKRELSADDFSAPKRSKLTRENAMNPYAVIIRPDEVEKVSNNLSGETFCILSGSKSKCISVDKVKQLVLSNGGRVVENPLAGSQACICLAGDLTHRVQLLRDTGLYNIVELDWLLNNFPDGNAPTKKLTKIKPRDMICSTTEMEEKFRRLYDSYGDSFTDFVDVQELSVLLEELKTETFQTLRHNELRQLEQELYPGDNSPNIFRGISAYFYSTPNCASKMLTPAKFLFQFRGGSCVDCITPEDRKRISVVFVNTLDDVEKAKQWTLENFSKRLLKLQIVSIDWIFKCESDGRRIAFTDYVVTF